MADTIRSMLNNITSYSGTGLFFSLMLICILALAIGTKKGYVKQIMVWFPVFVLAVYFCPVWVVYNSLRNDTEILYRLLWLLPAGMIICYTLVEAVLLIPAKYRAVSFAGAVLIIVLSGDYIYDSMYFTKADNIYHIPQTVIDICDEIEVPGREIRACFPEELVPYVRQYTPYIFMTFGRDTLLEGTNKLVSEAAEILSRDEVDADELCVVLRRTDTHFLVIDKDKKISGSMWENDFGYVTTISDYDIYLDNRAYIGLYSDEMETQ